MLAEDSSEKKLWIDCDIPDDRQHLKDVTSSELKAWVADAEFVIIDEAQRVKNIGITIKLLIDKVKPPKLIVSGSSALEIANEMNEPLTGRKWEFILLPFSTDELIGLHGVQVEKRLLLHRLIYGLYPEVVNSSGKEKSVLKQLGNSYL